MKLMKKIIFLDVDGVLNSSRSCKRFHKKYQAKGNFFNGYGGFFKEHEPATKRNVLWDPNCVDYLMTIIEKTGAEIVISSTWRHSFSEEKFKEMFAVYGYNDVPVIGKTHVRFSEVKDGRDSGMRGNRIAEYIIELDDQGIEIDDYVILDDNSDMLNHQVENHFVHTYFGIGLTVSDMEKAIEILNRGNDNESR